MNSSWRNAPPSMTCSWPMTSLLLRLIESLKSEWWMLKILHEITRTQKTKVQWGNLLNGINDGSVFMLSGQAQGILKVGDAWLHVSKFHWDEDRDVQSQSQYNFNCIYSILGILRDLYSDNKDQGIEVKTQRKRSLLSDCATRTLALICHLSSAVWLAAAAERAP